MRCPDCGKDIPLTVFFRVFGNPFICRNCGEDHQLKAGVRMPLTFLVTYCFLSTGLVEKFTLLIWGFLYILLLLASEYLAVFVKLQWSKGR